MKIELNGKVLTLFFSGELNSSNVPEVEQDVANSLKGKSFSTLILDFADITYVSSAGLRLVLKLKQKYKDVSVINVSLNVYDVFQMTGFTSMMPIRKCLAEVSVEGCEIIGDGYCSTVYRLDKDTILKVFTRTTDLNEIQRELNLAKEAFVLGIPTAISFDIVKVGERYGVRFELLDSLSFRDCFRDRLSPYPALIEKYATLLRTINTTESLDPALPSARKQWIDKCEKIKSFLDPSDYQKLSAMISDIPEARTFVHGDCHFKNIMVQNNELFLIDMDTLSVGDGIFELAAIYAPYIAFEEDDPGNSLRFLGVSFELTKSIFYDTVEKYLGRKDEAAIDKIKIASYCHMMWWNLTFEPQNQARFNGCKARLLALLPKVSDLNIHG